MRLLSLTVGLALVAINNAYGDPPWSGDHDHDHWSGSWGATTSGAASLSGGLSAASPSGGSSSGGSASGGSSTYPYGGFSSGTSSLGASSSRTSASAGSSSASAGSLSASSASARSSSATSVSAGSSSRSSATGSSSPATSASAGSSAPSLSAGSSAALSLSARSSSAASSYGGFSSGTSSTRASSSLTSASAGSSSASSASARSSSASGSSRSTSSATGSSCAGSTDTAAAGAGPYWSGWGADIYNNRWASNNSQLTSSTAGSLTQSCRIPEYIGISATPVVYGDITYFPTWDGHMIALDYKTCAVVWNISVSSIITGYAPVTNAQRITLQPASRSSPQVDGNVLYFSTLIHALLVAVDRSTGSVLSYIQIHPHELAQLTMSPTVYQGRIFIGASSYEEVAVVQVPSYVCCSFIGTFTAVDFDQTTNRFSVAWNVSMLPEGQGWSGVAVWGSQPAIDIARSQVFIGTGNVYTLPAAFEACQNATANISVIAQGLVPSPCIPDNVYQEAIMALDMSTGFVNWVRHLTPIDAWVAACGAIGGTGKTRPALCPYVPGPDADFGMAPTFVPGSANTPNGMDTLVIGQKNGELHALSAQAGTPFWSTVTSPDGTGGGLIWGIAADDTQVYFAAVNSAHFPWQPISTNKTIVNSGFGAASILDGSLVWEVPTPMNGSSIVPPSVVNDVVFFGRTAENITGNSTRTAGGLVAVNKATGAIIRDYGLDINFHGGIAIQDQYVMLGTGYYGTNRTGSFYVFKA